MFVLLMNVNETQFSVKTMDRPWAVNISDGFKMQKFHRV
jgi:hypothetical protein